MEASFKLGLDKLSKTTVIAVVDDDQSVREALASLVKSLGYGAVAFARAEDFLTFERRNVACLIADVHMPGMTGPDLYNQLLATGEPIPTILITAYPDRKVCSRALQSGVKCYLSKPIREEDLMGCIAAALGSPAGA